MTQEEKKEYRKNYYQKNKEKVKEYNKKYRKSYYKRNKKKEAEQMKQYRLSLKDGYHRVYLLEDYNYVGISVNIKNRFGQHKCKFNRDCTNHRILYKTKDRTEGLELEKLLHDIGYEGKNTSQYK